MSTRRRRPEPIAVLLVLAGMAALSACEAAPASIATVAPAEVFVTTIRAVGRAAAAPFSDSALSALGQSYCAGLAGSPEAAEQALVEGVAAGVGGHFGEPEFDLITIMEGAATGSLCPPASGPPSSPGASPAIGPDGTISPLPTLPVDELRGRIEDGIRGALQGDTGVIAAVRQVRVGGGQITIEVDAAPAVATSEADVSYRVIKFLGDPQNGLVLLTPSLRALVVDGPHFAIALVVHGAKTATSSTSFATLAQVSGISQADWATQAGLELH
jgi:hypothetical protein